LEEIENGREDEEEDVNSCRMILRKKEYTGTWEREQQSALYGEKALGQAMDLLQDKTTST
jgi:hypothetical protein